MLKNGDGAVPVVEFPVVLFAVTGSSYPHNLNPHKAQNSNSSSNMLAMLKSLWGT